MKYYRIVDEKGVPLHTGYNSTSKKELVQAYIDLMAPQMEVGWRRFLQIANIAERIHYIENQGFFIEESKTPFEE